jgi:hypothetical protein
MNLFLLFASLTLYFNFVKTQTADHHELRIEDIQKPTRMKNGIIILPIDNSNEDIISLERSVIRFLINHHYIVEDFIYQWEKLRRRRLLNPDDQNKILINEATIYKAIKKYQENNSLAQTGIMDMNILKKVFGNKYNGLSVVDAGGVYFLENIKTYGEDDPTIGKALRFKDNSNVQAGESEAEEKQSLQSSSHENRRKKRSVQNFHLNRLLRMLPEETKELINKQYEKKSSDL